MRLTHAIGADDDERVQRIDGGMVGPDIEGCTVGREAVGPEVAGLGVLEDMVELEAVDLMGAAVGVGARVGVEVLGESII